MQTDYIDLYHAYNPLAGGVLTGRYHAGQSPEENTRCTVHNAGQLYQARYWHEAQLRAVEQLKQLCDERHLLLAQVAAAWCWRSP